MSCNSNNALQYWVLYYSSTAQQYKDSYFVRNPTELLSSKVTLKFWHDRLAQSCMLAAPGFAGLQIGTGWDCNTKLGNQRVLLGRSDRHYLVESILYDPYISQEYRARVMWYRSECLFSQHQKECGTQYLVVHCEISKGCHWLPVDRLLIDKRRWRLPSNLDPGENDISHVFKAI